MKAGGEGGGGEGGGEFGTGKRRCGNGIGE